MGSKITLDLSKFKHVKSDKHTTTLKHKDGHIFTVAHNAMGKDAKAQLEALSGIADDYTDKGEEKQLLAEGGEVESEDSSDTLDYRQIKKEYYEKNKNRAKPTESLNYDQIREDFQRKQKELAKEDRSKPRKKMADGGDVESPSDIINKEMARNPSTIDMLQEPAPLDFLQSLGGESKTKAAAREIQLAQEPINPEVTEKLTAGDFSPSDVRSVGTPSTSFQAPPPKPEPSALSTLLNPDQNKMQQPIQHLPGQIAPPAMMPTAQAAQPSGMDSALTQKFGTMEQGLRTEASGLKAEQQALGEAGKQKAALQEQYRVGAEQAQTAFQNSFKQLQDEGNALKADIQAGHLDPQRYIKNMSTGDKIASALGLIISGMGAGLTHQPNMAMDYLNKQIDNDIMAQKADLGKKENLLKYTTEQMGNLKDGYQAAKLYSLEMLNSRLQQITDQTQDPIAKARVLQIQGQVEQKIAPLYFQLGQARAINSIMNQTSANPSDTKAAESMLVTLRQMDPERAKQLEGLIVPDVGVAKVNVPQSVRDNMIAKRSFDGMLRNFYNWAEKNSGSLDPKKITEGQTMAAEIQGLYRQATNGGVFKEGEQKFIDQIIDSNPTKFFNNIRVLPKLKEVINSNDAQLNSLKRGYGMPVGPIAGGHGSPSNSQFSFKPSK